MSEKKTITRSTDFLSRIQALQAIKTNSEEPVDLAKNIELVEAGAKAVELEGRRKYFALRDRWSTAIIWWISGLIIFNSATTVAVGLGFLAYPNLEWFITAVLVQTFLEIIALGVIAVKYLFSNSK